MVYIATASASTSDSAGDSEMAERIRHHRASRPAEWITVEEPLALGNQLLRWSAPERVILVDCLTLWLGNLLFSSGEEFPEVGTISLPALFHEQ